MWRNYVVLKETIMFKSLPGELGAAREAGIAPWTNPIREDFHVVVYEDKFPVTPGHLLFVPQYATLDVIEDAVRDAIRYGMNMVDRGECAGFNIGINFGATAGQTVPWPHVHMIPRNEGDCEDPIGGVRNVVPGQGNYKKDTYKQPK
jgi:diadenosine tetraphosphate (Ap4A) HIT family hydrolase